MRDILADPENWLAQDKPAATATVVQTWGSSPPRPCTSLEALARKRGFRKIFSADEFVGGRYSVLTDFGLVPAALLGMDLNRLLDKADWMRAQCGETVPVVRNPGLALGAVLGEAALGGRDKLTVISDAPLSAFAGLIEQIIAESSGKNGKGILPVPLEPLGSRDVYGDDGIFVYLRKTGEYDESVAALKAARHPVV
jgi:transaldolase / glucose-6-phosphate isomerase